MDLDKLIQNYEDIIEISKQTTADLEKTLALLKSQKLNQEKELSSMLQSPLLMKIRVYRSNEILHYKMDIAKKTLMKSQQATTTIILA